MWSRFFLSLLVLFGLSASNLLPPATGNELRVAAEPGNQLSYLGVAFIDVDPDRLVRMKLPEQRGVEVINVEAHSPAQAAGIEVGDVLLTYNGEDILGAQQFIRLVRETPEGRKVKVQVWRSGKHQTLLVTMGAVRWRTPSLPTNPANNPVPANRGPAISDIPTTILVWRNLWMGVELEQLDRPLAQFFGTEGGMLVRSVDKESAGERAGLKVGDVITSVASNPTLTARELISYFRFQRQLDQPTPLGVVRNHKPVTLRIPPTDNQ
jgi:serine protease Do